MSDGIFKYRIGNGVHLFGGTLHGNSAFGIACESGKMSNANVKVLEERRARYAEEIRELKRRNRKTERVMEAVLLSMCAVGIVFILSICIFGNWVYIPPANHMDVRRMAAVPESAFSVAAHRHVNKPWDGEWEGKKETP